jgi:hypothetical protein
LTSEDAGTPRPTQLGASWRLVPVDTDWAHNHAGGSGDETIHHPQLHPRQCRTPPLPLDCAFLPHRYRDPRRRERHDPPEPARLPATWVQVDGRQAITRSDTKSSSRSSAPRTSCARTGNGCCPPWGTSLTTTCPALRARGRDPRAVRPITRRTSPGWVTGHSSTGKRDHADHRSAKAHAKPLNWHLRPHICPECETWHVGHLLSAIEEGALRAAESRG